MKDARRSIPSVDRLLSGDVFAPLRRQWSRPLLVSTLQDELAALRTRMQHGAAIEVDDAAIAERVRHSLETLAADSLVPVINATGVVLHTNLGRAPLADVALAAMNVIARGYSTLEYDAESGARGSRYTHCRALLCRLTGAEDALVVNNNAAALVLALNTHARGLDAIVSRGELVEIGGAFRIPEIMARSGAHMREVGATNRTHIEDYRAALGEATGAVLKVHPSNFEMSGYTAETGAAQLAALAADARVPFIHDIGSGLLMDPAELGLPASEPTPQSSIAVGAGIITMSGDKLLGGPQCGIVLGSAELLERMRRNPLCRALRVDKLTLAALAATLRLYLEPSRARSEIPVLRMLAMQKADVEQRAVALVEQCDGPGLRMSVADGHSAVGGGAAAGAALATSLLLVRVEGVAVHELEARLRAGTPPVITRIVDDAVALDLRTVSPDDDVQVRTALEHAVTG
ncbi:MAG TPA: L-seryl-tRNA(Sec) selenium transferase [Longimicrobiales bacterium]|nr:L-seryl-tRNA(Sec) selenium transferase [Longimicrobiales bacterium]